MGKAVEQKVLTIDVTCMDCGATRTVAVQDAKQVKRCVTCQEIYRKAQRKEYRKNLVKDLRAKIAALETENAELKEMVNR